MRKKVFLISAFAAAVLIFAAISPSITSKDIENISKQQMINVEVNRYFGGKPEIIDNEMTLEEAEYLEEILTSLHYAIENNDEQAIKLYEKQLNDMKLFGDNYQEFHSNNNYDKLVNKYKPDNLLRLVKNSNGDDLSNLFCFVNAIGKGMLVSSIGLAAWLAFSRLLRNASSAIEALIIILVFLPLALTVIVLTSLIPFRILMPKGAIIMDEGSIFSIGLGGIKNLKVTENTVANISWFTGLSISIPGNNETGRDPFCFISGFAAQITESEL
jgi:hypothetical protein